MPSQHRPAGLFGYRAEMLRARRRFLESGHFSPLRSELAARVGLGLDARHDRGHDASRPACVLEAGCGEGYYLGGIAREIGDRDDPVRWLGTGRLESTPVRLAAKRYAGPLFFVADTNRRLYVQDASVDVLLDIFAPRNLAEFARVLGSGGTLLVVIPAEQHLQSIREQLGLLGIQEDKERLVLERFSDAFELADRQELSFPLILDAQALHDVVEMGPSSWHRSARDLPIQEEAQTQAAFIVLSLVRSMGRSEPSG